jgi:hypothetical protein
MDMNESTIRLGPYVAGLIAVSLLCTSGCAFQYFDKQTQTQHLFGLGHLSMRTATNDTQSAVITGIETWGLSFGSTPDGAALNAGWVRSERAEVAPAQDLSLRWQRGELQSLALDPSFASIKQQD